MKIIQTMAFPFLWRLLQRRWHDGVAASSAVLCARGGNSRNLFKEKHLLIYIALAGQGPDTIEPNPDAWAAGHEHRAHGRSGLAWIWQVQQGVGLWQPLSAACLQDVPCRLAGTAFNNIIMQMHGLCGLMCGTCRSLWHCRLRVCSQMEGPGSRPTGRNMLAIYYSSGGALDWEEAWCDKLVGGSAWCRMRTNVLGRPYRRLAGPASSE